MTTQVQPQDKTVFANGLNLHYLDWGTVGKPAMVLLHGLRGHAHSWDDFSGAVCQQYHVLALDQRGRGLSDWAKDGDYSTGAYVADLAAFCDALGLDSPVLVGHSMGGRNVISFAARYPQGAKKLVIVDMGPDLDPKGQERIRRELSAAPDVFDSSEAAVEYMSRQNRFASDTVLRRRLLHVTKELSNGKTGWRYDPAIQMPWQQAAAPPLEDLWPQVRSISCPALVVRGAETDILPLDGARKMVEAMPDGRLVEVQRAGHMVFEDNPDGFLEAVSGFLK